MDIPEKITTIITAMFGTGFIGQWLLKLYTKGEERKSLQEKREQELRDKFEKLYTDRIDELLAQVRDNAIKLDKLQEDNVKLSVEVAELKAKLEKYEGKD